MDTPILFSSKTLEWAWLSNFHLAQITDKTGRVWASSENCYQGMKFLHLPALMNTFTSCPPWQAKKMAKTYASSVRPDWESVKLDIMRRIIRRKFIQHPNLRALLLETGDRELIHDAPWGDTFWGVTRGQGLNWQGKITMEIRAELQQVEREVAAARAAVAAAKEGKQVLRFPHRLEAPYCTCNGAGTCNGCNLSACEECGGCEGSLPMDCPRYHMTRDQEEQVLAGKIDYINGEWVTR